MWQRDCYNDVGAKSHIYLFCGGKTDLKLIFTSVTSENAEAFEYLAPQGYLSEDYLPGKRALGVLVEKEGILIPAGLLIFFIRFTGYETSAKEGPSIVVRWIGVDEEFERKGIGKAMLDKLYALGKSGDVSMICFPDRGYFEWHDLKFFLVHSGYRIVNWKRVRMIRPLGSFAGLGKEHEGERSHSVKALKKLGPEELELISGIFMTRPDQIMQREDSPYDLELCAAAVKGKNLVGIFLISSERDMPDGWRLNRLFLGIRPKTPSKITLDLLRFSYERGLKRYGKDTDVAVEADHPTIVKLLRHLVPDCPVEEPEAAILRISEK